MYYLQSRYYDAKVGRFLNPDSYPSTGQGIIGNNMFAYCGNNPVKRVDAEGYFWDTIFDVASLVVSVIDVASNPTDIGAWVGLAGDLIDVAVPFVGGISETARVVNATMEVADTIHDTAKVVDNTVDATKPLHRPYIRKSTREAVENAAMRAPDGRFLDANTGKVIEGKYDLGHEYGHEFWRERQRAEELGWTQKEFNDYMNNPAFYRIEDPSINRSHKYEMR